MVKRGKDLTNRRFERLTVVLQHSTVNGRAVWECRCDCGNVVQVLAGNLRSGATRSCGCLQKERTKEVCLEVHQTHGLTHTPEYQVWIGIKARCYNKKNKDYCNYGGRGIEMSDEWRDNFEAFYRDMGQRPSPQHSIERDNNNLGYSVNNCKWATKIEQVNNRRNNILITFVGETQTLAEWCTEYAVSYKRMYKLVRERNMEFESALNKLLEKKP